MTNKLTFLKGYLTKIELYLFWIKKKIGIKTFDYEQRCGYFLLPIARKGHLVEIKSLEGKQMLYRIIDIEYYRDPWDMIKSCKYTFVGLKNEKSVKDCTFNEFLETYGSFVEIKKGKLMVV